MIKEEKIEFNIVKTEIFKWLDNLRKVFETISKKELLYSRKEINYKITLKIE